MRRGQIRKEALRQFAEQGLPATRIQDLAAGVGMAQGLFYRYYPSKDALFTDLIDDALDKVIDAATAVGNMPLPARDKLLVALRELLRTIRTNERFRHTCRLIAQARNSTAIPAAAQTLLAQKGETPYEIIAKVMAAGQREGSVVDGEPRQLSTLFWAAVNGIAIYCATRQEDNTMPDYRLLAGAFLKER